MLYDYLGKLLEKADCRYTLVVEVAKRARQLVDGAEPLVEMDEPNTVTMAVQEIVADKITFEGVPEKRD
ncbi:MULTISPECIES: DNA-directed RNA polymerase subunit omega [unclassified Clostridium]|uniref:DNA-directed RNA polymerase subunit omega n=1 Tax=unclassified Clostridium TaxID=2614128 RepID=UPI001106C0CF|nr:MULTISPECIES: DNA-directed RNA polymerase subunit omega [unclassified Clostridium]